MSFVSHEPAGTAQRAVVQDRAQQVVHVTHAVQLRVVVHVERELAVASCAASMRTPAGGAVDWTLDRPRRRRKPASSRLVRRRRFPRCRGCPATRSVGARRRRCCRSRARSCPSTSVPCDRRRLRLRRETRPTHPLGSHKPPSSEMSGRPTKASPPGPPDSRSSRNWSSPRLLLLCRCPRAAPR